MANDFATSYAEIFKYDKNDDGTLTVYGKATSDDLDIDNQICDNDWLSKAVPEWFKSGGNIREQHSSIAAGVATEYEQKGDGFYVEAKIVDPNSIRKVEHKVLKGFSIGIKGPRVIRDTKAANGRIVDGQIVELSLVDRPANPTCQLVLAKSVGGESTLTQVEELIEKYSPDQERDEHGRFGSGGGSSSDSKAVKDMKAAQDKAQKGLDNMRQTMKDARYGEVKDPVRSIQASQALNAAQGKLDEARAATAAGDHETANARMGDLREAVYGASTHYDLAMSSGERNAGGMPMPATETGGNRADQFGFQGLEVAQATLDHADAFATHSSAGKSASIDKKTDYEAIIPERKGSPADKDLYAAVIADAKEKFDVYPSAVANAWVSQEYKKRGGKYSNKEKSTSKETPVAKSVLAETILELVKSAKGDTVKFDQASYDTARRALAQLIITEAGEMADGSDERDDIEELIDAIKHLFRWKDGEDEEGETNMSGMTMQMSAKEADADCECDGCKACKADGGCDSTPCMKCMMAKSASVEKCLECGCGMPGQDHGLSTVQIAGNNSGIATTANVSTATIMTPDQLGGSIKSAEGEEAPVAEEATEEAPAAEEAATNDILDESAVAEIVEKAVKSATESVKAEIASLQAATKAAEEKAVALESELVTAKSAAVSGGPKRTGRIAVTQTNELLLKAAEYKAKAAATSDPILVKGYKSLEKEFLSKAGKPVDQD